MPIILPPGQGLRLPPSLPHAQLLQSLSRRAGNTFPQASNVWLPVRKSEIVNKRTGEHKRLEVFRVYQPELKYLNQLEELWNKAWRTGIDESNPCAPLMKEALLVGPDQIKSMHDNSWSNILMAAVDGKIVAAIWGNQLNLDNDEDALRSIRSYDLTTENKTFGNNRSTGNSRLCVSVVNNPDFNGFTTVREGISVGQFLVLSSLIEVVCNPYQTDVYAFSRPSSLSRFVEIIRGLERQYGVKIRYDHNSRRWISNDGKPVSFEKDGVKAGDKVYALSDINEVRIMPADEGYILMPEGLKLFMDEKGVYVVEGGNKDYIAEIKPYIENTNFDQMAKFHGGRGGELAFILPQSRVNPKNKEIGDLIALNYNIVFHFPIGVIIKKNNLLRGILRHFSPQQREVVRTMLKDLRAARRQIDDELRQQKIHDAFNSKRLFGDAFSFEKMWPLLKYVEFNR